jgi:hypothetical protein
LISLQAAAAQLRHAYAQLHAGTVKDQRQFAEGLIAPAIAAIERHAHQQAVTNHREDMGR